MVINKPEGTAGWADVIKPETVSVSGLITMVGWAIDPQTSTTAKGVLIISDGKPLPYLIPITDQRPDVIKALNLNTPVVTGWSVNFKASYLGKGEHKLQFYAVLNDEKYALLPTSKQFSGTVKVTD